jgi:E3 ubiquitin-protein ligase RNF13/E3 ubiquitin-protein ligase RNF167
LRANYLAKDAVAAFGAEIDDPILGYIIPLSAFTVPCASNETTDLSLPSNTGCPPLCTTGPHTPTDTWIALVQRGHCEFVKKVREAQRLGAKAVVVGGDDPAISGYPDTLVNMYSPGWNLSSFTEFTRRLTCTTEDASDIKIAATYIKFSDYMQLYTLIGTSNTTHSGLQTLTLLITAEYSAWEWYS